jgi:hypothetical protein
MPILSPSRDEEIAQGDVLQDVALHVSDSAGTAKRINCPYCLVVSRDCVAAHKPRIVVVPVRKMQMNIPREYKTFDEIKQALEEIRDGSNPDRFYLGTIGDGGERYAAHLDQFCTVGLPEEPAAAAEWVKGKRVASLHDEFRAALRARLHWVYARPGFHDHDWFCDRDLAWLLDLGESKLKGLEGEVAALKAEREKLVAGGKAPNTKKQDDDIAAKEAAVAEFKAELAGFTAAKAQREG